MIYELLKKQGYKIYRLSFDAYSEANVIHYNPLTFTYPGQDSPDIRRNKISEAIVDRSSCSNGGSFWNDAMKFLFSACFEYFDSITTEYTFADVYQLLNSLRTANDFSDFPIYECQSFKAVLLLPAKTITNIIIQCMQAIQAVEISSVAEATRYNDFDLSVFRNGKIALFIDRPQYCLMNKIRDQFFSDIIEGLAKVNFYDHHMMVIFDDIHDIALNRFIVPIVYARNQNISFWIGISSIMQLRNKIEENTKVLMDACNIIFLDTLSPDVNEYFFDSTDYNPELYKLIAEDETDIVNLNNCLILLASTKCYAKARKLDPGKVYKDYVKAVNTPF